MKQALETDEKKKDELKKKNEGDHIPQDIKDAFNLPKSIKIDYEIDFE